MAQVEEKVQIDYAHKVGYNILQNNQIGTDADFSSINEGVTPSRVVPIPTGDIAYVRKFGEDYEVLQVTNLTDPIDVNMTFTVKSLDGTVLASRVGGGLFVAGATLTTAQNIYCEVSASGGIVTALTTIAIVTDVSTKSASLPAEIIGDGDSINFYVSNTRSTYYDVNMRHGGARLAGVLNNILRPYFDIATAYSAIAGSNNDAVCILDSETYDEELTLDKANTIIYANTGQAPINTSGIGARVTREQTELFNNINSLFFNENGNDSTGDGTWQNPYLTIGKTILSWISRPYLIYGGIGATVNDSDFVETIVLSGAFTLEPEYGYMPKFNCSLGSRTLEITNQTASIKGFYIHGLSNVGSATYINISTHSGDIHDNTYTATFDTNITSIDVHLSTSTNIKRNIINNFDNGVVDLTTGTRVYDKNIFLNCAVYGLYIKSAPTVNHTITNNYFIGCGDGNTPTLNAGIYIDIFASGQTFSGSVNNNTFFECYQGISVEIGSTSTLSGTIEYNLMYGSVSYDLFKFGAGANPTATSTRYDTVSNWTLAGSNVTSDPLLCSTVQPYRLGISSKSPCYRVVSSIYSIGVERRQIEIDASDIVINGIKFDGQEYINTALYILDTVDHTGFKLEYCSIRNYDGFILDVYDDDTNTGSIISNNLIYNNGDGIRFNYGGNTITNNVIHTNNRNGIYAANKTSEIKNNVIYNNSIGIYLDGNASTIKDCIIDENSINGIYSSISVSITYCCLTDSVTTNVNKSSITNVFDNPLFVDVTSEVKDFRLKRNERDNIVNSPCIGVSSNGGDIGAYDETATVSSETWDKYLLSYNPTQVNEESVQKNTISSNDSFGNIISYMADDKIRFPFEWSSSNASNKEQRLKIKHFQNRIPSQKNTFTASQCEFRVHPAPISLFGTGTGAINASGKTITDATAPFTEDEKKGWHVGLKYDTGLSMSIDSILKTGTVAGTPWTDSEWIGYYMKIDGYYYYISENDSNKLTLLDSGGTLKTQVLTEWSIEKYFKVKSNNKSEIVVIDDNEELIDGEYDYYFDFVLCKVVPSSFKTNQIYYDFLNDLNKNGYGITWEDID